ncbi:MAG TPA: MFS transporter [Bacillota bacterium]|nr:MFS transporter [Bacillota bacterium]
MTRASADIKENALGKKFIDTNLSTMIFMCSFLVLLSLFSMKSTLGLFVKKVGGTTFDVGTMTIVITFTSAVFRPITGRLIDSYGSRSVFILAGIIAIITPLAHLVVDRIIWVAILMVVIGIGRAFLMTSSVSLFLNAASSSEKTTSMLNLSGLTVTVSTAVAPIIALYLLDKNGFVPLYGFLASLGLLGLLIFATLPAKLYAAPMRNKEKSKPIEWRLLFSRPFLTACIPYLGWAATNGALMSFLPLFGKSVGVSNVGIFFTIYAVVNFAIKAYIPWLMRKMGHKPLLITAFTLIGAGMLGLWGLKSVSSLILPAIAYGLGTSAVYTPLAQQVVDYMPKSQRMSAMGVFMSNVDVGQGLGAMIFGTLASRLSYGKIFVIMGVWAAVAIAAVIMGPKKVSEENEENLQPQSDI